MRFLEKANLPDRDVSRVIIGEDYSAKLREALEVYGVKVFACPNNCRVDPRLRSHADLSVLHLGGNRFIISEAVATGEFVSALRELGAEITLTKAPSGSKYPDDAGLCAAVIGSRVFHNSSLSVLSDESRLINVKQGYAKCTVCIVNENAVITSDKGLAKKMAAEGLDVLTISDGYISLEGYNNGFIGGSAFKIATDKLAFTGNLEEHPDKAEIEKYLFDHGVKPLYLTEKCIFDIGSAIPVL